MRYNFHIKPELLKLLQQRAKLNRLTVAELIRRAIVEFLAKKGD